MATVSDVSGTDEIPDKLGVMVTDGPAGMRAALARMATAIREGCLTDTHRALSEMWRAMPDDTNEHEREALQHAGTAAHDAGLAAYMDAIRPAAGRPFWESSAGAAVRAHSTLDLARRRRSHVRLCIDCDALITLCECN